MLQRVLSGDTLALFDVHQVAEWRDQPRPVLARVRSALHMPLQSESQRCVLVLVHSQAAFFTTDHIHLLQRLAPLANQALTNIEHRERLEAGARDLHRLNRTLRALSHCNQSLARASSESELLEAVCRHVVETGGYRLAWVGYVGDDAARRIRPVAHVGSDRDYVDRLELTWGEDELRRGVGGTAVATGQPIVVRHVATDPLCTPWRAEASRRGLASCLALPLLGRSGMLGVLSIYSADTDAFDEEELRLLAELASNLGYGISGLREADARMRAERELDYRANFDMLTGLPNRSRLHERLGEVIAQASRTRSRIAVVLLNVDRFRVVNDGQGPAAGDALLVEIARRVAEGARADDMVARLSGDEFVIVLADADEEQVAAHVRRFLSALEQPVAVAGGAVSVSASIGVCLYPQDGADAESLIRNAGAAMRNAKSLGGNGLQFFSPDMNERASRRLTLEAELRLALQRDELVLHFQPKVSLDCGSICGAEALVRWEHPDRRQRSPAQFIPIAEETGLIRPIGEWVLRSACAAQRAWQQSGLPVRPVAVNLSARQFHQNRLVPTVAAILRETGLPADLLELEITESMLMSDVDAAVRTLYELKALGVGIALDDFGTGYSSLNYLKRFPLDRLKIDKSFVSDITSDPQAAAICIAIIGLAHNLGMRVTAEGVETAEQMWHLRSHGCDAMQGFYFSAPLDAGAFAGMLAEGRTLPVATPQDSRRITA